MEKTQNEAKKPTSNVKSYFTAELNEKVSAMSLKEMETTLKGMVTGREWIAILKYSGVRMGVLENKLKITRPVDAEGIYALSWTQGAMAGLCDLENYVIDLNSPVTGEDDEKGATAGN